MTEPSGRMFTQAQLNSYLAQERRRIEAKYQDYDDLKARAGQLDALLATVPVVEDESSDEGADPKDMQDVGQSDNPDAPATLATDDAPQQDTPQDEMLQDRAAREESPTDDTVRDLQTQLLRQQISAQRGLDPDLWEWVKGTTPDEIAADAAKLVAKFGTTGSRPPRGLSSGASAPPDGSNPRQRAAAALRGMDKGRG